MSSVKKGEKLKILAFHGYRQNSITFKSKIGSFRKATNNYAQLTFLSAPHIVRTFDEDSCMKTDDEDQRGWWFNAEDNSFSGKRLGGPVIGFEETLKLIENVIKENGPFDGFMGFSQGACLVGILASMQQKGFLQYNFKFAILVSGFCSGSLVHKSFYDEDVNLPTLHVFGENDAIIPKEMSEELANTFINPSIIEHSGGHYVPCSGSVKDQYADFFSEQCELILSGS